MELEPNVSSQQKKEEEFLMPFYNVRAKIQGQILFKRRGMIRFEEHYQGDGVVYGFSRSPRGG